MKTENRHINFQEPEGMMLLRYIKDTASNEEKSYIEAWLEADENNKRILLQTARIYYATSGTEYRKQADEGMRKENVIG